MKYKRPNQCKAKNKFKHALSFEQLGFGKTRLKILVFLRCQLMQQAVYRLDIKLVSM